MWRLRRVLHRLYHSFRPHAGEVDLQREIASHLAALEERFLASGIDPEASRLAALRSFGGVQFTKEQQRDARSFRWLADAHQDSRHAFRALRKTPISALVAVASLALGLGTLVGVYATFDWLVNRPPGAVRTPSEVIVLNTADRLAPGRTGYFFSYAQFQSLQSAQHAFSSVAAYGKLAGVLSTREQADQIVIEAVSGEFFPLLGVAPALGRLLGPTDDNAASPIPVVVSHAFWRSHLAGDPTIVGRALHVNGQLGEVVGVAPRAFESMSLDWNGPTDVWVPLTSATALGSRLLGSTQPFFPIVARLRPAVTERTALQEMGTILPHLPSHLTIDTYHPTDVVAIPLGQMRVARRENGESFFRPLIVVCGLVLLAGCFNLSDFVSARVHARQAEFAIRSALGAGRIRLLRQLVVESGILAAAAILASVPVCFLVIKALSAVSRLYLGLPTMAKAIETTAAFDSGVFLLVAGIGTVCTLLFGVLPGLPAFTHDARRHPQPREVGRYGGRRGLAARQVSVAAQVALAVALSLLATLYALSFLHVSQVRTGYGEPEHVLLARLNLTALKPAERSPFYRRLLSVLLEDSVVEDATLGWNPPYLVGHNRVWRPGQEDAGRNTAITAGAGRFFAVQQVAILAGREFDDSEGDIKSAIVINSPLARALWPGRSTYPLGDTVVVRTGAAATPRTIVGVAADDKCDDVLGADRPCAWIPLPFTESASSLRVRTRIEPARFIAALRRHVRELHPDAAVSEEVPLDTFFATMTAQHRLAMLASAGLALFAVGLVTVGLASVFSAMVRQRERDLALRMALGAQPWRLRVRVLSIGAVVVGVGVLVGTALGWWASRLVAPQLHAVQIDDPRLLCIPVGLVMVALAAVAHASRLIGRVDPSLPLKSASVG